MKKNLLAAAFILLAGGTLAACGTSESTSNGSTDEPAEETITEEIASDEAVTDETATGETATEEATTEEAATEEAATDEAATDEAATDEAATDEAATDEAATEEAATNETSTGETVAEATKPIAAEGKLTQSDEQPYELHVLPGYELASEEPGKDSLYLTDDPSVFMRIETFDPSEMDFSQAASQMQETLKAINADTEIIEGPKLEGSAFINSSSYEVPSAEGKVTGIVFEKENLLIRLTIFDSSAVNATENFIAMGKTIERTK